MPRAPDQQNAARRARTGQGWCMPGSVRGFGRKLMEQQLWCWGRDIECPGGNLLMGFGFDRHRCPGPDDYSTCYRLDDEQIHVCMWGFGMFFGCRDLGGLYLGRFDFCPRWAPVESLSLAIHQPAELPVFARPRGRAQWECAHRLWKSLLLWNAGYETWVRATAGSAWRRECVRTWLRPFVAAGRMAPAWRFLSRRGWERPDQRPSHTFRRYTIQASVP